MVSMGPSRPTYRWMMFVDGENLALRAKDIARASDRVLSPGPHYMPDTYIWFPNYKPTVRTGIGGLRLMLAPHSMRSFYYTAVQGDEPKKREVEESLWTMGFSPVVFKKAAGSKSKGVDIRLTIDLLTNAFNNNYDLCILVAGDGDYVPIVKEVQRYGKVVSLAFFGHAAGGLGAELKLASDEFFDITETFLRDCTTQVARPIPD
jgi:NYN domain-containing protein